MVTGWIVLVGVTLCAVVLLCRLTPHLRKAIPPWLAWGLVGTVAGTSIALAIMHGFGWEWEMPG